MDTHASHHTYGPFPAWYIVPAVAMLGIIAADGWMRATDARKIGEVRDAIHTLAQHPALLASPARLGGGPGFLETIEGPGAFVAMDLPSGAQLVCKMGPDPIKAWYRNMAWGGTFAFAVARRIDTIPQVGGLCRHMERYAPDVASR